MIPYRLQGFFRDKRGAAAIEMALIAPVIAGLAAISYGIWQDFADRQDARAALDVAADYYMQGGGTDSTAQTLAVGNWPNPPEGITVAISRDYKCGASAATDTTVCPGNRSSAAYVTMMAYALKDEASTLLARRVVRVR